MGGGTDYRPYYPKEVWTPTGGWYCDPPKWRRNTALTFVAIFAIAVPVFLKSAELEQRPHYPTRPVLSQLWCKNFPDPPEGMCFNKCII